MNSLGNLESNIYRDAGIRPEGAAMMILLKYYMIRGKFQQAESLCREPMEMEDRVYTLQADYNYIFSKEGEGNSEVILQVPCTASAEWTANQRIAAANAGGKSYFTVTEAHNRFWIPQAFIDESKGAIRQNPGY